ncbi:MAG: HAD family hydrolase [Actinomycetota bacterium]
MSGVSDRPTELTDGYERATPRIWLKSDQTGLISQIDSVILDIDGVVIDVSASFRVAISQTVQLYLTRQVGFSGDAILVLPSETQLFKLAGGYNNDWDLSSAAIMFYLAKAELLDTEDLNLLRTQGMTLEEFTAAAGRAGGGMHGAMTVLFPLLDKRKRERAEARFDRQKIETLFQELYGGVDYCERLYGHKPKFNKRKGLLNEERVLLDKTLLEPFMPKVGILTGRTKEEAEVGLERAGLNGFIASEAVFYDNGSDPDMRKPRPTALHKLAAKLDGAVTLYVGDVMDDLLTVKNANVDPASPCVFLSAIIVNPLRRDEAALFMKEGADIVSLEVNEAIKAVIARRQ